MSRLQLEISTPAGAPSVVPLELPEYSIGRDPSCTLCLDDARVSRQHARIAAQGDAYFVEDAGSSNGIMVDDQILQGKVRLVADMRLQIGGHTLTVRQIPEQRMSTPPQVDLGAAAAAAAPRMGRYVLVAINGPRPGSSFPLDADEVSVGRDANNTISIDDPSISRQHARLNVSSSGLQLTDLGSSNGSYVNEVRCTTQAVRAGNRLRFGQVAFDLVSAGEPDAASLSPGDLQPRLSFKQWAALVALAVLGFMGAFGGLQRRLGDRPDWRGTAEKAEEAQLNEFLQNGEQASKEADWQTSLGEYRKALRLDPVNAVARAGLSLAETQRRAAQIFQRAHQAVKQGVPLQALNLAAGYPEGLVDAKVSEFFAAAGRAAASEVLQVADAACRAMRWPACQLQAATLLLYLPQDIAARALVQEAENGLRTAKRAYRSFPVSCGAPWRRLPQADIREAVLRYASGDMEAALHRLANYRVMSGAMLAMQRIKLLREAWAAGESARSKGNLTAAMGYYARGADLDAQILGSGVCSVWGSRLRSRVSAGLQRAGQQAFDRGQYAQAFNEWQKAQRYDPDNPEVAASIGRLENRAQSMIGDIGTLPSLDDAACERLKTILQMTLPNSAAHRAALAKQKDCRALSEDEGHELETN